MKLIFLVVRGVGGGGVIDARRKSGVTRDESVGRAPKVASLHLGTVLMTILDASPEEDINPTCQALRSETYHVHRTEHICG